MKEIKIKTEVINRAAKDAGTTPEGYLGHMRSISIGRKVCAHFKRTSGAYSIFICA